MIEQKLSFLTDMMNQNIDHARHVETERLTFVSFQLMGFGLLLSDIGSIYAKPLLASILITALFGINIICTFLLQRWADIFKRHMKTAQKIKNEIQDILSIEGAPKNHFFIFENENCYLCDKKRLEVCVKKNSTDDNKIECNDGLDCEEPERNYRKTPKMFKYFNRIMYALLIGIAVYIWGRYFINIVFCG
jgi:hypothetical protein